MLSIANKIDWDYASLDAAFPPVDPRHEAFGMFVIVQIRTPTRRTRGGVIVPDDARETDHYNTQVAKVRHIGPGCFKSRDTGIPWPEGSWFAVGDFVRVPKYGGDRWSVPYERVEPEHAYGNVIVPEKTVTDEAIFALFKDLDCRARVLGDPLTIKAFL